MELALEDEQMSEEAKEEQNEEKKTEGKVEEENNSPRAATLAPSVRLLFSWRLLAVPRRQAPARAGHGVSWRVQSNYN